MQAGISRTDILCEHNEHIRMFLPMKAVGQFFTLDSEAASKN